MLRSFACWSCRRLVALLLLYDVVLSFSSFAASSLRCITCSVFSSLVCFVASLHHFSIVSSLRPFSALSPRSFVALLLHSFASWSPHHLVHFLLLYVFPPLLPSFAASSPRCFTRLIFSLLLCFVALLHRGSIASSVRHFVALLLRSSTLRCSFFCNFVTILLRSFVAKYLKIRSENKITTERGQVIVIHSTSLSNDTKELPMHYSSRTPCWAILLHAFPHPESKVRQIETYRNGKLCISTGVVTEGT